MPYIIHLVFQTEIMAVETKVDFTCHQFSEPYNVVIENISSYTIISLQFLFVNRNVAKKSNFVDIQLFEQIATNFIPNVY